MSRSQAYFRLANVADIFRKEEPLPKIAEHRVAMVELDVAQGRAVLHQIYDRAGINVWD